MERSGGRRAARGEIGLAEAPRFVHYPDETASREDTGDPTRIRDSRVIWGQVQAVSFGDRFKMTHFRRFTLARAHRLPPSAAK